MTQQLLGLILILLLVGILLAALVLPFFYLRYIDRLEKSGDCSCSEGFNRNFIKFYSAFVYVSIIVLIFSSFIISKKSLNGYMNSDTRLIMSVGFSFLIAFSLYRYQKFVFDKKNNCWCASKTWEPNAMKIHSYVLGVMVFLSCLNIIGMLMGHPRMDKNLSKSIKSSIKSNIKNNLK